MPTSGGLVWLKDNPAGNAFEPALTALLAHVRPDALPEVIAYDGPRLLTRDVCPRLRDLLDAGAPAPSWEEVLALYGEVHVDFMPLSEGALALGAPDERPDRLPSSTRSWSAVTPGTAASPRRRPHSPSRCR